MTKYYGVLGNRDHIKIDGEKRPFHDFLNVQPDGWLTSLVYAKGFHRPPNAKQMIFDCGAWSYRLEDTPPVNVESVISDYTSMCNEGDICVSPDHMLMPDCDVSARLKFSRDSAVEFIQKLPDHLNPMVCVHGLDLETRAVQAREFWKMGYKHIAVGGIAAKASSPKYCIEVVERVREVVPYANLHVMGLSSPNYFLEWNRIGVDSCDGSSHFKQAFTGGAFFSLDWNGKLVKHQAARRDNDSVIPDVHCDCGVCETMRGQGIDTRSYGSNENNMGRAVHNMNMLMLAQRAKTNGIRYLVSCVSQKKKEPTTAGDMYTSAWFRKAKALATEHEWNILSAKHGLLDPNETIEPYEQTLGNDTEKWSTCVANMLPKDGRAAFILAGRRYRKNLTGLLHAAGVPTYAPLSGLGIGQQLAAMTPQLKQQELSL